MEFKKLILASLVILMSAQSVAFAFDIKTEAQKCLDYLPKSPEAKVGCAVGIFGAAVIGAASYCIYKECQKKKAEKDFWNKKSDSKIVKLAEVFMQDVEDRLAPQLEKLRTASPSIKANLATLQYVCDQIETCQTWLERLTKRSLFACAQRVKDLESDLKQLRNEMDIFVNNDFIKQFETLSNKVRNQPPVIIAFPPYPYGYNYCY
jgi:hypothetical protein